jgi:hypothetical protein
VYEKYETTIKKQTSEWTDNLIWFVD